MSRYLNIARSFSLPDEINDVSQIQVAEPGAIDGTRYEINEIDEESPVNLEAGRLAHRVQLTTDGHKPYLEAVEGAFGADIDYAMLIKMYGPDPDGEKRYSPAECIGTETRRIMGDPDPKHISTSYAERQNLTMRMGMRRFTRLTNAFSKKVENLAHAVSLHFTYYNFCRVHMTLKRTPAMAAGLADHVWTIEELVGLLDSN